MLEEKGRQKKFKCPYIRTMIRGKREEGKRNDMIIEYNRAYLFNVN